MKPIPTETATDVGSVGKWLGAAAAGALLMYLLDPERGPVRRRRAVSALRTGAARTGATVDHALHSASAGIGALTGTAADAISRGAGKLQAQAAPLLERARHGVHGAEDRFTADAKHASEHARRDAQAERERYDLEHSRSYSGRNRYDHDERYADRSGGLAGWLQGLGDRLGDTFGTSWGTDSALLGGSLLGLLGVMRRNPAGLLVGLAGLALLMRSSGTRRYSVGSLPLPSTRLPGAAPGEAASGASTPGESAPYQPPGIGPGSPTLH